MDSANFILKSEPEKIPKDLPHNNVIEVIGGIKEEPNFLKSEIQESVEITIDDLLTSSSEDDFNENEPKPNRENKIIEDSSNNFIETDKSDNDEDQESRDNDNIDCDDEFYMKSNLDEGETLVLNNTYPHKQQKKSPQLVPQKTTVNEWSKVYKTNETTNCQQSQNKVIKIGYPISTASVQANEYRIAENGNFQCNHCEFITMAKRGKKSIVRHIASKHHDVKEVYQCPYCPYKSKWHIGRNHFLFKHTNDKDVNWFKCDKCDRKCKTKTSLKKHLFTHYNTEELQVMKLDNHKCGMCEKTFKVSDGLRRHIKLVHCKERLRFKCKHCDFSSSSNSALKSHVEGLHSDSKKPKVHRCEHCKYETIFRHRMKAHVRLQHLMTKIMCEICGHETKNREPMRLHQLTHQEKIDEKELKYRCDKCDYKTYRIYSLQVHKLNHLKPNQIKYFYCYHCDFKAKRKDNLKTHVLRHFKKEEVNLQCYLCDFSTKKRKLLNDHLGKNHGKKCIVI